MEHWQGFTTGVAALSLGVALLIWGRRGTGRFALVALCAGLYVLSLTLLFATHSMLFSDASIVTGAALIGSATIFAVGYGRTLQSRDLLYLVPLVAIAALGTTTFFVSGSYVDPASGKLMPVHGPGGPLLVLIVLGYCIVTWTSLAKSIRRAQGMMRVQARIIFVAFSVLLLSVLVCNVALPVLGWPALNGVTGIALLAFLVLVTYALSVRRLFDVQMAIYRGVTYGAVPVATILGSVAGVAAVRLAVEESSVGTELLLSVIGGASGALFSQAVLPSSRDRLRRTLYPDLLSAERIRELVADTVEPLRGTRELRAGLRALLVHLYRPASIEFEGSRPAVPLVVTGAGELRFNVPHAGTYVLQGRKSGEPYTRADSDLAEAILPEVAAAASRAAEHEQIAERARDLARDLSSVSGEVRELREGERRLVADIAHGLQTPLVVLRAEVDSATDVSERVKLRVARAVDDLALRVRSLITYARAGVPLVRDRLELVPLHELVHSLCEYVQTVASERHVALHVGTLDPVHLPGNTADLETMLTNLVSNALEHAGRGEPPHEVFINLSQTLDGAYLTVADTGPGMSDDDRARAFEPLYRGHSPRAGQGMGLGLAIAKQVVTTHGGTITLSSRKGGGTLVEVLLPAGRG